MEYSLVFLNAKTNIEKKGRAGNVFQELVKSELLAAEEILSNVKKT